MYKTHWKSQHNHKNAFLKKKKTQMQTLIISIQTHAYVNLKDKIAHSFAMRVSIQKNNSSSLPKS